MLHHGFRFLFPAKKCQRAGSKEPVEAGGKAAPHADHTQRGARLTVSARHGRLASLAFQ